jgi:hypothetical protein
MLSEGVDMPWLRWLGCRRPISSKVLFAQYVGRGLRSLDLERYPEQAKHGPKKRCVVLDPHNLSRDLSIDADAILNGGEGDDSIEIPALELDFLVDDVKRNPEGETLNGVPARLIDPTESYLTRVRLDFQVRGLISMRLPGVEWRREPMTSRQKSKIERLAWVVDIEGVPESHRKALKIAGRVAMRDGLTRGTASDLISILRVLEYGWPGNVDVETGAAA